jgi:predicted nucleic acid-binding protein
LIAYLDSSVLLRKLLGQPGALKEWGRIEAGVASAIAEVECLRTLDRVRTLEEVPDAEMAVRRETVYRLLESVEVVEASRAVLARSAQPMPTVLGTLDAIHLATALLWRENTGSDLVMATHDGSLALAARAAGFRVIGA